jgi:hypothetical protein
VPGLKILPFTHFSHTPELSEEFHLFNFINFQRAAIFQLRRGVKSIHKFIFIMLCGVCCIVCGSARLKFLENDAIQNPSLTFTPLKNKFIGIIIENERLQGGKDKFLGKFQLKFYEEIFKCRTEI